MPSGFRPSARFGSSLPASIQTANGGWLERRGGSRGDAEAIGQAGDACLGDGDVRREIGGDGHGRVEAREALLRRSRPAPGRRQQACSQRCCRCEAHAASCGRQAPLRASRTPWQAARTSPPSRHHPWPASFLPALALQLWAPVPELLLLLALKKRKGKKREQPMAVPIAMYTAGSQRECLMKTTVLQQ